MTHPPTASTIGPERVEKTGFGCVHMDIQMPEMDGFECTAMIRAREQQTQAQLAIIAMTARGIDTTFVHRAKRDPPTLGTEASAAAK